MLKCINNILLDDREINVLKKYNININNYNNIRELQIDIEFIINDMDLNDEEIEELDYISEKLQERQYYNYTNK